MTEFSAFLFRRFGSGRGGGVKSRFLVIAVKVPERSNCPIRACSNCASPNNIGKNQTTTRWQVVSCRFGRRYEMDRGISPGLVTSSKRIRAENGQYSAVDMFLKGGAFPLGFARGSQTFPGSFMGSSKHPHTMGAT